jgi:hypothetical protein
MNIQPAPSTRWAAAELALLWAGVAWLQLVGVVTGTILHHIIHALPLVALGFTTRSTWARRTRATAGIAWIVMLAFFTPMIWHTISWGVLFGEGYPNYLWLAPGMVLIASCWASASLTLLRAPPRRPIVIAACTVGGAVALALLHPAVGWLLLIPIERLLAGEALWLPIVLIEAAVVLVPIALIPRIVARAPMKALLTSTNRRTVIAHTTYWVGFVACMIAGLAVDQLR